MELSSDKEQVHLFMDCGRIHDDMRVLGNKKTGNFVPRIPMLFGRLFERR